MSFRKPNREQVGREAGEKHIYLHIPDGMAECVFDLEFLAFKYVDEKDFFVAEFKVIATDTPVKAGKTISVVLNPRQKLAEVYFYRDLYNIRLALRGRRHRNSSPRRMQGGRAWGRSGTLRDAAHGAHVAALVSGWQPSRGRLWAVMGGYGR